MSFKHTFLFLYLFRYMLLADYESYIACQERVSATYNVSFFMFKRNKNEFLMFFKTVNWFLFAMNWYIIIYSNGFMNWKHCCHGWEFLYVAVHVSVNFNLFRKQNSGSECVWGTFLRLESSLPTERSPSTHATFGTLKQRWTNSQRRTRILWRSRKP